MGAADPQNIPVARRSGSVPAPRHTEKFFWLIDCDGNVGEYTRDGQ
jgi:hypothetical protein